MAWIIEDPLVRSYKWLRLDMVRPAPFFSEDLSHSRGSGVLADKAGFPSSVGLVGEGPILAESSSLL